MKAAEFLRIKRIQAVLKRIRAGKGVYAHSRLKIKPGTGVKCRIKTVLNIGRRFSAADFCRIFYIIVDKACRMNKLNKRSKSKNSAVSKFRFFSAFGRKFCTKHHKKRTPALSA